MNGHTIPNTPIAVDFWKIRQTHRAKIFFLSHCHADHMDGLSSTWSRPVYCSEVTAEILKYKINVRADLLHPLEFNRGHIIPLDEEGLETMTVNLIDANHCPGAAMFLFEGYFGKILYTGDFRFHDDIFKEIPHAKDNIDILYLDNTYCSPFCVFPSRDICERAIQKIIEKNHDAEQIIIGVRNLGKEDLLVKVAEQNQEWIGVSANMHKTAEILNLPDVFTTEVASCRIRTEPVHLISAKSVKRWSAKQKTVVIIPSALHVYQGVSDRAFCNFDNVHIIPYSDHSSYNELVKFVSILKPKRVLPIVSGNAKGPHGQNLQDRANMDCFSNFLDHTLLRQVFVPPSVKHFFMKSQNETSVVCQSDGRASSSKVYWQLNKIRSKQRTSNKGVLFLDSPVKSQEQCQEEVVPPDSTSSTMDEDNVVLNGAVKTFRPVATKTNFDSPSIRETTYNIYRPDSTKIDIESDTASNNVEQYSTEDDNLGDLKKHCEVSSSQSQESYFDCHDKIQASEKSHYSTPQGKDIYCDSKNPHEEIHKNNDGALTESELTHPKIDLYFKDGDLISEVSEINECSENKNHSFISKMAVDQVNDMAEECYLVSSQTDECATKYIEYERVDNKINTENYILPAACCVQIDRDDDIIFDKESLHEETNNCIDKDNVKKSAQKQGHISFADLHKATPMNVKEKHVSKHESPKANMLQVTEDSSESYDFSTQPFVPRTANSPVGFASTQTNKITQEQYSENSCFDFCTQPFVPHEDLQSDDSFVEGFETVTPTEYGTSDKSSNQAPLRDNLNSADQSDCDISSIHLQGSSNPIGHLPACSVLATQSDDDNIDHSKKHTSELDNSTDNAFDDEPSDPIVASEENMNISIQSSPDVIDSSLPKALCTKGDLIVCMSKNLESDFSIESIPYDNKNNPSIRMDIETRSLTNCEKLTIQLSDSFENVDKNTSEMSLSTELNSFKDNNKSNKLCRKRLRLSLEDTNSENESEKPERNACKRRRSSLTNSSLFSSKIVQNRSNSKENSSLQSITSFFSPTHSSTHLEDDNVEELQQEQHRKSTWSTESILPLNSRDTSERESWDCHHSNTLLNTKSISKTVKARNENNECASPRKVFKRTNSPKYSVIPISSKRTKQDRHQSLLKTYNKFCSY